MLIQNASQWKSELVGIVGTTRSKHWNK